MPILSLMGGGLLAARCVLAVVFLVAAGGKLLDLAGSRRAVHGFGVPVPIAHVAGVVLPVVEALAAILLLVRPVAVAGAGLALVLLLGFMAGVGYAMSQGRAPDCHCFGQFGSEPAGPSTLVRNGVLAALAVFVLLGGRGSSWAAVGRLDAAGVGLLVLGVLSLVLTLAVAHLWAERRRLRTELDRAIAAKAPAGLPRGTPAPEFTLPALRGATPSLAEVRAAGKPAILVFLSTRCGPCLELVPQLARWQETVSQGLSLLPIFSGSGEEIAALCEDHELAALAQENDEIFELYALRATPSAVRLAPDGSIAGPAAEGAAAIEAMVRASLSNLPGSAVPARLPLHAG